MIQFFNKKWSLKMVYGEWIAKLFHGLFKTQQSVKIHNFYYIFKIKYYLGDLVTQNLTFIDI